MPLLPMEMGKVGLNWTSELEQDKRQLSHLFLGCTDYILHVNYPTLSDVLNSCHVILISRFHWDLGKMLHLLGLWNNWETLQCPLKTKTGELYRF